MALLKGRLLRVHCYTETGERCASCAATLVRHDNYFESRQVGAETSITTGVVVCSLVSEYRLVGYRIRESRTSANTRLKRRTRPA